jgi:hypothetical protein
LFLGWGLNPHPKNLAFNFQLSTFNFLNDRFTPLAPRSSLEITIIDDRFDIMLN